jgi:hypothetical protein
MVDHVIFDWLLCTEWSSNELQKCCLTVLLAMTLLLDAGKSISASSPYSSTSR